MSLPCVRAGVERRVVAALEGHRDVREAREHHAHVVDAQRVLRPDEPVRRREVTSLELKLEGFPF